MNKQRVWRWVGAATAVVTMGAGTAACSDDAKADPTTTTTAETVQQFLDRVQADCPSFQPGFDEFYTSHPDPTPADYAEFLPTQIDGLQAMVTCIEQSGPPASITADVDNVVTAMSTVVDDFQKALDAAKADDLDNTNKWITQMHDVDVAKIDAAMQVVAGKAGS